MLGPTRVGTSRLARWLTTILPAMSRAEALVTTRIPRGAGRTDGRTTLDTTRPFRAPHHTISDAGLIGGGHVPLPGDVSLAHNGVRFLDERPESRRHVLEVLRQPLEEGVICIRSRGRPRCQCFRYFSRTAHDHRRLHQRIMAAYDPCGDRHPRGVTTSPPHIHLRRRLVLFA